MTGGRLKAVFDLLKLAGGQTGSKVLGFLAFAWLSRVLSPSEYGVIETLVGMGGLGLMAIEFGTGTVGIRRIAGREQPVHDVIWAVLSARVMLAALLIPPLALAYGWLLRDSAPPILVALFAAGLLTAIPKFDWLFQACERMGLAVGGFAVRMAAFLLFITVFSPAQHGLVSVGVSDLAAGLVMVVVYGVAVLATVGFGAPRLAVREGVDVLRQSFSLGLSGLAYAASSSLPLLVVATMSGPAEGGVFAAAQRVVVSLQTFSQLYYQNLFPSLVARLKSDPRRAAELVHASDRLIAWAGAIMTAGLVLFAEPLMRFAFGSNLAIAAREFAVACWVLPITLASGSARWLLVAQGRSGLLLTAQTAGAGVTLVGAILLAPHFGGMGACWATVAGALTIWVLAYAGLERGPAGVFPSLAVHVAPAALLAVLLGVFLAVDLHPAIEAFVAVATLCGAGLATPSLRSAVRLWANAKSDPAGA